MKILWLGVTTTSEIVLGSQHLGRLRTTTLEDLKIFVLGVSIYLISTDLQLPSVWSIILRCINICSSYHSIGQNTELLAVTNMI